MTEGTRFRVLKRDGLARATYGLHEVEVKDIFQIFTWLGFSPPSPSAEGAEPVTENVLE
jgi:hypothetical protein